MTLESEKMTNRCVKKEKLGGREGEFVSYMKGSLEGLGHAT